MFKRFSFFVFLFVLISSFYTEVFAHNNLEVSNEYFSFVMPYETKGTYSVDKEENGIYICEKISKRRGQGGFAFGVLMYKNPNDYADMEDVKKIGELTDKNGTVYDIVLCHPREIYYGNGRKIAKNYNRIYDFAPNIEIKGINGNKYIKIQDISE